MQPPSIDSVIKNMEVNTLYQVSGIALTLEGNIVAVERNGSQAAIYSSKLVHLRALNVTGAIGLYDIVSSKGILFITDTNISKIHVMRDNESYIHAISTSWLPFGIDINDNYLFVVDYFGNKLYRIELDQNVNRISSDQVILNGGPVLSSPIRVCVRGGKIAISNYFTVVLSSMMGEVEWIAGTGLSGTGPGEFYYAFGVRMDNWRRVLVSDRINERIQLLSANGTHIKELITGIGGWPYDVMLVGDTLYVSQIRTNNNKLVKYTITYL